MTMESKENSAAQKFMSEMHADTFTVASAAGKRFVRLQFSLKGSTALFAEYETGTEFSGVVDEKVRVLCIEDLNTPTRSLQVQGFIRFTSHGGDEMYD